MMMADKIDRKRTEAINMILDEAKIVGGEREIYHSFASQILRLPLICVESLQTYYQIAYNADRDVLEKIVAALIKA
jgi:hypothetical protein